MMSMEERYQNLTIDERNTDIERMLKQIDQNARDLSEKGKHKTWYKSCKNLIYLGIMEIDYAGHLPEHLHLSSTLIQ